MNNVSLTEQRLGLWCIIQLHYILRVFRITVVAVTTGIISSFLDTSYCKFS